MDTASFDIFSLRIFGLFGSYSVVSAYENGMKMSFWLLNHEVFWMTTVPKGATRNGILSSKSILRMSLRHGINLFDNNDLTGHKFISLK